MWKYILLLCGGVLAGCMNTVPDLVPVPNGATVRFQPDFGPAFLARRSANVYVAQQTKRCGYDTLGVVRNNDLSKGTSLQPGKEYSLRAILMLDSHSTHSESIIDHVLVPRAGAQYDVKLIYYKDRKGMRIFENGKLLPMKRPCLTETIGTGGGGRP